MPAPLAERPLTLERLKEVLNYDPDTGIFTWAKRINPRGSDHTGRVAGRMLPAGYLVIRIDERDYQAQRLAWFYVTGAWPRRRLRFLDDNIRNLAFANLCERIDRLASRTERTEYDLKVNPRAFRAADLNRDFGITVQQYQEMFVAQGGVCAICREPEKDKRNGVTKWLAIDHCHEKNTVRGLLCFACNSSIGRMKEDPARLRAAAAYIEAHRAIPADDENVIRLVRRGKTVRRATPPPDRSA